MRRDLQPTSLGDEVRSENKGLYSSSQKGWELNRMDVRSSYKWEAVYHVGRACVEWDNTNRLRNKAIGLIVDAEYRLV